MKKETIRGLAYTLAATSMITVMSGCTKNEVSIPETASITTEDADNVYEDYTWYTGATYVYKGQEYKEAHDPSSEFISNEYTNISYENGLSTSSLFFIRINGKIYLSTKLTDINENNIISKYYAIDTGEFLGQTLDINWYARATKDIDALIPPKLSKTKEYKVSLDNDLKDYNYFNGEYGLGKNLCAENVINATSVLSEKRLTKEQIDNLLTDSLLTTSIVEKYLYLDFTSYKKEEYTFIPLRYSDPFGITIKSYTIGFNGETSIYFKHLYEFTIEEGNSTKKIIGYRASINQNDSGFSYLYDIESSSYIDLSQVQVLDIKEIVSPKTVGKIRKDLDSASTTHYFIEDLKVLSTINLEGEDIFEKYYIAMRGNFVALDTYQYEILGENEFIALSGSYDGSRLCLAKMGSLKFTPPGEYNGLTISLEKCLEKNNLSCYIKDTYTEEELSLLLIQLRNKTLDLGEPINEQREAYKKINIKDIVVVDTSKESGESVLVEAEKKYYVLIPYERPSSIKGENSDVKHFEICDNTGFGAISFDRKFVLIDNFQKTYYAVLKYNEELECISSLEDVLREIGLSEFIREEYALIDLQTLADRINEKQNTLVLN